MKRAGGTVESVQRGDWGAVAVCADPFGNGFCLVSLKGRIKELGLGRDALPFYISNIGCCAPVVRLSNVQVELSVLVGALPNTKLFGMKPG